MVELLPPAITVNWPLLVDRPKSGAALTVTRRVAPCVNAPLVPVIVIVYCPGATLVAAATFSVLVDPDDTGLLLKSTENPDGRVADRDTLPLKPPVLVMLTRELFVPPGNRTIKVGLMEI